MSSAVTNQVDRMVAISEIKEKLHRYAFLAREEAQWQKMVPLFTKTGVFRISGGPDWRPTEISKVVQGEEADFIRHHISTVNIEFVDANKANVESYYLAVTDLESLDHWGCWKDIFERQDDGTWLIADRTVEAHGGHPNGWLAKTILRMAEKTSL